jgi:MraZ protein
LEHTTTGDGCIAALNVLAVMKRTGLSLSQLNEKMEDVPQVLINTRVRRREELSSIPGYSKLLKEIEEKLAKLPSQHPTKKKYLDRTSYYGQSTSLDKSGRILIPVLLRESAKMAGEVAVLGAINYLYVWNHDRIKTRLEHQTVTNEDKEILSSLGI